LKSTLKIELKNGVHILSGMIDETADFTPLTFSTPPLKLNLKDILSINSTGLRTFLQFLKSWAPKEFEYYECSAPVIHTINVLPSLLGEPASTDRLKSLALPYLCENCHHDAELIVNVSDLVQNADEPDEWDPPNQSCEKCSKEMSYDGDPVTYFLWLSED
jgi:hypothetical protein